MNIKSVFEIFGWNLTPSQSSAVVQAEHSNVSRLT